MPEKLLIPGERLDGTPETLWEVIVATGEETPVPFTAGQSTFLHLLAMMSLSRVVAYDATLRLLNDYIQVQ